MPARQVRADHDQLQTQREEQEGKMVGDSCSQSSYTGDDVFRYLRNAATFKDIRAGENGLELFKVEKIFLKLFLSN